MRQRKLIMVFLAVWLSVAGGSGFANAYTYYGYSDWGGTWHDVNKNFQGDDLLCWAAAASNILAWSGWGLGYQEGGIFNYFKDYWTNLGGSPNLAWNWWFDGTQLMAGQAGWSQLNAFGGGNFWPGLDYSNYRHTQVWGNVMATAYSDLKSGYGVTLGIFTDTGGAHSITLWGVDYYTILGSVIGYTGVWITDSDDKKTALVNYGIYWDFIHDRWCLEGGLTDWYIGQVEALGRFDVLVPLPPSLLLLGSGLLGLAGWRRFRKG
jgi:hypothetical protein